jgi:hypothetical protein
MILGLILKRSEAASLDQILKRSNFAARRSNPENLVNSDSENDLSIYSETSKILRILIQTRNDLSNYSENSKILRIPIQTI